MVSEMNKEIWICTEELFPSAIRKPKTEYYLKKKRKLNKRKFYLIPIVVLFIYGSMFGTRIQTYRETINYTITEGDTLWDISRRFLGKGYKYLQIALDNDITNPDLIYPGEQYRINIIHTYYINE